MANTGGAVESTVEQAVILNIYNIIQTQNICCGLYHTGLEMFGVEYSFGALCGVYECPPRLSPEEATYAGFLVMGSCRISCAEFKKLIDGLRIKYDGASYDLITMNCNDFCNELCMSLVHRPLPAYINRLTRLGKFVSCLIPKKLRETTSQNQDAGRGQSNSLLTQQDERAPNPGLQIFSGNGNRVSDGHINSQMLSLDSERQKRAEAAVSRFQDNTRYQPLS